MSNHQYQQTIRPVPRAALFGAALLLSACSSSASPVGTDDALLPLPDRGNGDSARAPLPDRRDGPAPRRAPQLATVETEGKVTVLYLQRLDGSGRHRVHFHGLHTTVPGDDLDGLQVDDATVIAFPALSFSRDGSKLAVVVSVAFDEGQIVVMDIGEDLQESSPRIVSHNQQYIMGEPAWAPDGHAIAYAMSVTPQPTYDELFTSALGSLQFDQLTDGTGLPGLQVGVLAPLRYLGSGEAIAFTQRMPGGSGFVTHVRRVSVATHAIDDLAVGIDGTVSDVFRDGTRLLITRQHAILSDGSLDASVLVHDVATTSERTLLGHAQIVDASLDPTQQEAFVTVDNWTQPLGHAYSFRRIRVQDGSTSTVPVPAGVGEMVRKAVFF